MIPWRRSIAILALVLTGACASSAGGDDVGSDVFVGQLGRVLYTPLQEAMNKILPKYRIAIRRAEEQRATLYYETEWKARDVTPEERAEGVADARHRVIIRGRRVGETLDGVAEFRVTMTAENEVRTEIEPSWHATEAPASFFEYWEAVYNDFRLEVATGVRR